MLWVLERYMDKVNRRYVLVCLTLVSECLDIVRQDRVSRYAQCCGCKRDCDTYDSLLSVVI